MASDPKSSAKVNHSGIHVVEARVKSFRSLNLVSLKFDALTLIIGENNSGKTSFLDALQMAIGQGSRSNFVEDIFLAPNEKQPPKSRTAIVDLLIKPANESKIIESFPEGSPWLLLWGNGIAQDKDGNDFVGIRTTLKWDAGKAEYSISRNFLAEWKIKPDEMEATRILETAGTVSWSKIEPLALYFMDAKRDINDELHNRNSFWGKLVSDIGLSEEQIGNLESQLSDINKQIVDGSKVLGHIVEHLGELYHTVTSEKQGVSVTPLNRHLRDFRQGMDVQFATTGAQSFPLSRHGMGTRSLASVLIFRAYMTWRQAQNKEEDPIHPMLALEEPESHLHPQAQRALFINLEAIPGQRIITSHSPFIVSQANIKNVRHFHKNGAETIVSQLDTAGLDDEAMRKIDRMVLNTRGDILFAKGIVLFEGETEEQALPIFAGHNWGKSINTLGLSFVGVGGDGNYLPFLRLASSYGIPWYILADGEDNAQKKLSAALKQIGINDITTLKNVVSIPKKGNYESYIIGEGYVDAIEAMLNNHHSCTDFVLDYMTANENQNGKGGVPRHYSKKTNGREIAILDILRGSKTAYGSPLAIWITKLKDTNRQIPKLVKTLFDCMTKELNLEDNIKVNRLKGITKPAQQVKLENTKTVA